MNLENHPCFNEKVRLTHGRIHLPVAPRCNMQCNFCSRKYDCVNESRPGVTSDVLSPQEALAYLNHITQQRQDISVVGIAGPGDPFANPHETMQTLELVRAAYPEMLLCIATNGLNLPNYVSALSELNLSHVTVTVNAIDPNISAQIYRWMRYGKHVYRGEEAAEILLENQLAAISQMKKLGIIVKVNTVIIGGINDEHAIDIAEKMSELKVDILNCIPFYAVEGSAFAERPEPTPAMIHTIRKAAGEFIPQMQHCTRCRADAIGLLSENNIPNFKQTFSSLKASPIAQNLPVAKISPERPYIAVTSREGMLVNQHLGEAEQLYIFSTCADGTFELVAKRATPSRGNGDQRWQSLAGLISDCHTLLVNGIGSTPTKILSENGLRILEVEGMIPELISALHNGKSIAHLEKSKALPCSTNCSGSGGGCG
jgi:nitrogen fixation protein NifB